MKHTTTPQWYVILDGLTLISSVIGAVVSILFLLTVIICRRERHSVANLIACNTQLAIFFLSVITLYSMITVLNSDLNHVTAFDSLCIWRSYFVYTEIASIYYSCVTESYYRYMRVIYTSQPHYSSVTILSIIMVVQWIIIHGIMLLLPLSGYIEFEVNSQMCSVLLFRYWVIWLMAVFIYLPPFNIIVFVYIRLAIVSKKTRIRAASDSLRNACRELEVIKHDGSKQQVSQQVQKQKEPVWDGNKVEMTSVKLATDVYAIYAKDAEQLNSVGGAAATSGGLIVGQNGVLLIETLLNQRLNQQVQQLSTKLSNNKPILFAVNTSSHGDHWYGNMYLPETTMIIQHQKAKEYIDQHLDEDKAFMVQNFGQGRGIEEIKARTGSILVSSGSRIQIDLGGKLIDIIDFGFAQTGGDLFIWESQSKVLWTGNPIIALKPSLPWLLDGHVVETLETLKKVYDFLPSDATIIPGHGIAMKPDDLRWHIDYLTALQQNVQRAIDGGLSLEQTVKKTTDEMSQFRGYVLFDWIHSSINVSKAYEELKK